MDEKVYVLYNEHMGKNFRKKREDTKIGSVEKQYGVNFDVRSDMKLGKYLEQEGFPSLSKALERAEKNAQNGKK